ncbi:ketosynthase chain-length factor [Kitasatospora sp. NPDC059146]|uniref:ketosynthase chain-length factor n=1 Tax=Kitasatospora sp. NPDC059146 TaxID=3346741 RepID=UPI00369E8247
MSTPATLSTPATGSAATTATAAPVVTGLAVLAPNGFGTEAFWAATLAGRHGIGELTRLDTTGLRTRLAGEIRDFDATALLPGRLLPQTDVSSRYALVAAEQALADAELDPDSLSDYAQGVCTSTAQGGFEFTHREFRKLWKQGPEFVSVYESFAWFYAVNTGQISIRHKMRGPSAALVGEQAGGLDALGHARRGIRQGTALMLSGGVDSAFDPWGWAAQLSGGRTSPVSDPTRAFLPFDRDASGHLPGEGGAMLVIEDAGSAARRGAPRVLGELAGYAATFDPRPGSGRPPGLRRAAELAIADAGLLPSDIDVVFADAAGSPAADRAEAEAITAVFGPHGVPVTAPKSLFGRLAAGGGPVDTALALLSIRDGVVPATAHTTHVPQEYGLDPVRGEARPLRVRAALVLARGHRGFNAALVVTAPGR